MGPLKHGVRVTLERPDLALILTDLLCGDFGLFKGMECQWVSEGDGGQFKIDLAPKAKPKLAAVKPGSPTVSDMVKS